MHLQHTRPLFGQIGFRGMELVLRLGQFVTQGAHPVFQRDDSNLCFQRFQSVFRLIQTGTHLIGLLRDKVESTRGSMHFQMFNKVSTEQFV